MDEVTTLRKHFSTLDTQIKMYETKMMTKEDLTADDLMEMRRRVGEIVETMQWIKGIAMQKFPEIFKNPERIVTPGGKNGGLYLPK